MAALHLFDYADENLVSLRCPRFLLFDAGFVEEVQVFQSLVQLHHAIHAEEGLGVSWAACVGVGE